jgi:hypothetical protein
MLSAAPGSTSAAYTVDALGRPRTRAVGPSVDAYAYVGASGTAWGVANSGGF